MLAKKYISLTAILVTVTALAMAQDNAPAQPKTNIKHVPIASTSPASGKEMFANYCAVCHGSNGTGGGPAASALKTAPPDLTGLAKKNGGKFPSNHVAAVIRGQADMASHGSRDMPVWGPLFLSISQGHESQVQQRVANLVSYIESLQAK